MYTPVEPTGDQCNDRALVGEDEHSCYYALWYPQMGGYSGKAVVQIYKDAQPNVCFDVWVWHDGEFPFSDEDADKRLPATLHHCMAEQFVTFGHTVQALQAAPRRGGG